MKLVCNAYIANSTFQVSFRDIFKHSRKIKKKIAFAGKKNSLARMQIISPGQNNI